MEGPEALGGPEAQKVSILITFIMRERVVWSTGPKRLEEAPGTLGSADAQTVSILIVFVIGKEPFGARGRGGSRRVPGHLEALRPKRCQFSLSL